MKRLPGYFCHFPLGAVYQNIPSLTCMKICLQNSMCTGINFRLYEGQEVRGECVTVAPGPTGKSLRAVDVVDITKPGWEYYGRIRK